MKKLLLIFGLVIIVFSIWVGVQAGVLETRLYLPLIQKWDGTATKTSTPTMTPTVTLTVTPVLITPSSTPIIITPSSTPVPQPAAVVIVNIFYDGAGANEPDEYVEIRNDGGTAAQLFNWTLSDESAHVFTFPDFSFQPGQTCRIYTNENHPEWCGFSYGSGAAIWNNGGDCATLRDENGQLVDQYCYP
jgi:hypothetical protein